MWKTFFSQSSPNPGVIWIKIQNKLRVADILPSSGSSSFIPSNALARGSWWEASSVSLKSHTLDSTAQHGSFHTQQPALYQTIASEYTGQACPGHPTSFLVHPLYYSSTLLNTTYSHAHTHFPSGPTPFVNANDHSHTKTCKKLFTFNNNTERWLMSYRQTENWVVLLGSRGFEEKQVELQSQEGW